MRIRLGIALLLLATVARASYHEFTDLAVDPGLETKIRRAAEASLQQFPKMKAEDLAISVVDLSNATLISRADYHGDLPFYPASVIKLFFMADVYAQHKESLGDVQRALKEMIVLSDNDATAYLVDMLAGTSGGSELSGWSLRRFTGKRRAINKRFAKLGYDISAMSKPWSFGPFGRDRQVLGARKENRNRMSANATTSLMLWIVRRRAVSAQASEEMMGFLQRPLDPLRADENQVKEFIGEALPAGSKLWSKAGWTSEVRHDAAYIELPNGKKYVMVIFTRGLAADVTLIPAITKNVFTDLQ